MSSTETYFYTLSDDDLARIAPFFEEAKSPLLFQSGVGPFNRALPFRSATMTIGILSSKENVKTRLEFCGKVFKLVHLASSCKHKGFPSLHSRSDMLDNFQELAPIIIRFLKPEIELVLIVDDVATTEIFTNIFDYSVCRLHISLSGSLSLSILRSASVTLFPHR